MKVRCIESNKEWFTVGNIYDYSEDSLIGDDGNYRSPGYPLSTWNRNQWDNAIFPQAKFEEVKGDSN